MDYYSYDDKIHGLVLRGNEVYPEDETSMIDTMILVQATSGVYYTGSLTDSVSMLEYIITHGTPIHFGGSVRSTSTDLYCQRTKMELDGAQKQLKQCFATSSDNLSCIFKSVARLNNMHGRLLVCNPSQRESMTKKVDRMIADIRERKIKQLECEADICELQETISNADQLEKSI